jgi:glycosyltransferase involved in cell wall biosynthesis
MKHGKTGYLVEPYNTDQLANQLIEVLDSPEEQEEIVEAAYDKLKSYFNLNRMVDETITFYQEALG